MAREHKVNGVTIRDDLGDPMRNQSWTVGGVQHDPDGRAFTVSNRGEKAFLSPFAQDYSVEEANAIMNAQAGEGGMFKGQPEWDAKEGRFKRPIAGGNILAMGIGAAMGAPWVGSALGGMGGAPEMVTSTGWAPAGSSAATAATGGTAGTMFGQVVPGMTELTGPLSSSQWAPGALANAAGTGGGGAVKGLGGIMGKLKGWGIDPTMLGLGALSMFGGDEGDNMQSFAGTSADPVQTLTSALNAIQNLSRSITSQGPVRLRTAVQPGPVPVNIPGIPFQIGGGLGIDPALGDPRQGEFPDPFAQLGDLFAAPQVNAKRRTPTNG